jgi:hypothetical protein
MDVSRMLNHEDNVVRYLCAYTTFERQSLNAHQRLDDTVKWSLTYNILFEYGDANLKQFFASIPSPVSHSSVKQFWLELSGIVSAVRGLQIDVTKKLTLNKESTVSYLG